MTFKPYETYRSALPVLKVGHVIKAGAGSKGGSGFWIIKKVMEGRIKITEAAPTTKKQWISKNGEVYKQVSGSLDTEKIVHLQYLACIDAADANVYWGGDGYTNFYCIAVTNYWPNGYYDGTNQASINRMRGILRPFAYQYPDGTGVVNFSVNGNGISFVPMPSYLAFKSNGNGKVYYVKPILNNSNNQLSPIFQAELWFPWSETVGLIDSDVIAVEGTTTKYLCKSLDSPDSTSRLIYAIKYVA